MSTDLMVGMFGGFMTGLVLSGLLRWLVSSLKHENKPLSPEASLRVRHIQSRHWH